MPSRVSSHGPSKAPAYRGVAVFLVIAFGGAWSLWAIARRLGLFDTGQAGQILVALGAFSPALAALVVRKWVTHEGFGDAGLALPSWRKWPYVLLAWLAPLPDVAAIVSMLIALSHCRA